MSHDLCTDGQPHRFDPYTHECTGPDCYVDECQKHKLPAIYTKGRCIKCMDDIPLDQLEKPDFKNPKNFNI